MFIAYRITCLTNGEAYIGITKRSLNRRWLEHVSDALNGKMTLLHRSLRQFGCESFTAEEICCAKSVEDICAVEALLIQQEKTMTPAGFNAQPGGRQFSYQKTAESIERSAAKHRGNKRNPEASERAAIKLRGRKKPDSMREKLAAYRTGKKHSEESRAKIAAAKRGISCNTGEKNGGAKLTANQVREARMRLASGESQRSIARSFEIHYNAIWKIANGKKWKDVA